MKTKEEVAEWLKKQEWVEQFKNGIIKTLTGRGREKNYIKNFIIEATSGAWLYDTISDAFVWSETKEGHLFWKKVNKEFLNWYNN